MPKQTKNSKLIVSWKSIKAKLTFKMPLWIATFKKMTFLTQLLPRIGAKWLCSVEAVTLSTPRGVTWVNFCWVCATGLSEPLSHYSLFCGQIIDPILVTFWQMQFWIRDPNLVTFCLWLFFIEPFKLIILKWTDTFVKLNVEHLTFHLRYKHSGTCASHTYLQTYCHK